MVSENGQCLPPLILLLRAIEFRRERGDLEAAGVFRSAVTNHLLPQGAQQQQGNPTNSGPLWRRSLSRWIRGVVEHEMVASDLLNAMNGTESRGDEMELMSRCRAILTSTDIGPEAVISDDLLTCAACYFLCKVSLFPMSNKLLIFFFPIPGVNIPVDTQWEFSSSPGTHQSSPQILIRARGLASVSL